MKMILMLWDSIELFQPLSPNAYVLVVLVPMSFTYREERT